MSVNLQLLKLDDKDWNRISADELLRRLLAQNATDNFGDLNHKTFGFKTREGGAGILQIMQDRFVPGTATREPGVKIRYRLLADHSPRAEEISKSEFTARLPDGSFVELVSLKYGPGSNPRRTQGTTTNLVYFWKPDGTRNTEYGRWSFGASQLSSARNPDLEYRGIVARWGGPDANNARLMGWQFDDKPPDSADGQFAVTPKAESAANWIGLMQSFPRDQKTATIRFALASGPYISGPSSNVMWATTAQTPYGSFTIGKVFDHNGNAAVTLTHNLKDCDYRLVTTMPEPRKPKSFFSGLLWEWKQESRRGKQFQPVYGRRVEGTEFSGKWEFPGIASTNEPRVWLEVRPVQWVEFRNVALNPGEPTKLEIHFPKKAEWNVSGNKASVSTNVPLINATASFGIYLMEEPIPGQLAVYGKGDWKNIPLLDAPIITADDLERYEWNDHRLVFRAAVRDRLPRPPVQGLGFVVVVNGERIYPGLFTTSISSFSFALPNICVEDWNERGNSVAIERAYPGDSFGVGADPRNDDRVRTALGALGKLDGRNKAVGGEMGKAPYESLTITTNDVVRFVQPGVGTALVKFENLDEPVVKFESRWKRFNGQEGMQKGTLRQSAESGWQTPVIVHAGEKLSFEWSEGSDGKAYIYFDPTSQKATLLGRAAFDAGF